MEHRWKNVRDVQGYCRSFPKPNSANFIIWVFFVFVLLPPKTTTIMRSLLFSAIIAPLNPAGFCQNKPPCPTASWKLTSATCPILYPFATSKPAPKLSNLQLCRMWGFHKYIVKFRLLFLLYYFWQKTRVSKRVSKMLLKLNFPWFF